MAEIYVRVAEAVLLDEQVTFTLSALCQASGSAPEIVHALVSEGLLQPTGQGPADWQFSGDALPKTRKAFRLARDLDLDMVTLALVMDLLDEIDRLRSRLRHREDFLD